MQQHCRSLDQERNRRAHSLNGNTAPAAGALVSFIMLSREGKNGFASCTFILMWCGSTMRLHRIVVDRCFFERLCTDAPAPPAAGAKEFRLRRVGRNTLSAIMRLGGGQRPKHYFLCSQTWRKHSIHFNQFFNAHRRDPTICHEKALKFYDFFVHKLSYEALMRDKVQTTPWWVGDKLINLVGVKYTQRILPSSLTARPSKMSLPKRTGKSSKPSFFSQGLHPWKLTWHWKIPIFNRKYIFKWWIFHCHVSFRGVCCTSGEYGKITIAQYQELINPEPKEKSHNFLAILRMWSLRWSELTRNQRHVSPEISTFERSSKSMNWITRKVQKYHKHDFMLICLYRLWRK